jgi:endonuclease YncB( thermonuclease family)
LQNPFAIGAITRQMESRMQILIAVLTAAVVVASTTPANVRVTRSDPVLVRSVIDGDTIDVSAFGRVRLLGIDAPEIGRGFDTSAPFGREARARLTALIQHRFVRLEQEGATLDVYSRRLAYVMTEDGQCVNVVLVREGLARVSARTPLLRLPELQRAEAEAQASRRGMWGSMPQIPPRSYTHQPGASRPPKSKASTSPAKRSKARPTKKKAKTIP